MDILFKITDKDLGIKPKEMKDYRLQVAARGIIVRNDGKIAIQNKINKNEYKLVGGGIEENEDPITAFKRELLGYQIKNTSKSFYFLEYKHL